MKRRTVARAGVLVAIALLAESLVSASPASAGPFQAASAAVGSDMGRLLEEGRALEQQRRWLSAIEHYEKGSRRWPDSAEIQQRLRTCEIHFDLARRYQDPSYLASLRKLSPDQVLDVYQEALNKIQSNYVDPVTPEQLTRLGVECLTIAIGDPEFQRVNLGRLPGGSGDPPDGRVRALGDRLRAEVGSSRVFSVADAQRAANQACDLAGRVAGLAPTPVVLEFVAGACHAMDSYSAFLSADRLAELYAMIDGEFVGLGIEVRADDKGLMIMNVLPGGPAERAGLKAGDRLVQVGAQRLAGLTTEQAANKLQGPSGSVAELWVVRGANRLGDSPAVRMVVERRAVNVKSIRDAQIADRATGVGYIKMTGFQKSTAAELDEALWRLHGQGMRALILDLRGNPGGLLSSAVEVSDRFLEDGPIVSTRGRAPGQSWTHFAQRPGTWRVPLVVLIDGDSASASEIVAGALKDQRRATLVGETTYGKGSVQSILPMRSTAAGLRLTTARFYSPLGHPYSHRGVSPDVPVRQEVAWRGVESGSGPASPPSSGLADARSAGDPGLDQAVRVARSLLAPPIGDRLPMPFTRPSHASR